MTSMHKVYAGLVSMLATSLDLRGKDATTLSLFGDRFLTEHTL